MIRIICPGKIKEEYLTKMINDYLSRINKYHKLEIIELKDSTIEEESKLILSRLKSNTYKVALSINGNKMDSISFSKFLTNNLMNYANIDFIIGGSNGLSEEVLSKVNYELSFSDLTFPHGLFRAILLEQIYRGFKIYNNEIYHK